MFKKIENPDKEHEDIKIVLKPKKAKLKEKNLTELLAYMDAVEMVHMYYDNLAKANEGNYDSIKAVDYAESIKKANEYQKLSKVVFEVIKEKVDEI